MRKFNPMRALPGFQAPKTFLSACVMLVSLTATAGVWDEGDIEAGQALFNANCASCHKVTNEVLAAPGRPSALPVGLLGGLDGELEAGGVAAALPGAREGGHPRRILELRRRPPRPPHRGRPRRLRIT